MIILGTNSIKDTGYDVANSCRFNDGSSDYMHITPSGAGNRRTFTFSFWFKRSSITILQEIFSSGAGVSNEFFYGFRADDTFEIYDYQSATKQHLITNRVFRDVGAWYHFCIIVDTTDGTAANRTKLFVNGTQETSFSTETYPSQNDDLVLTQNQEIDIGRKKTSSAHHIDGYLAEVVFIDGTAYAASDFGEFDSDSPTIWKPKDVSGLTFGTNGFYLDFENSGSLGADVSGNSNNFTVNNLTAIDSVSDVPTNNFATLNPLIPIGGTFSEGNLQHTRSSAGYRSAVSSIGVSSGKWYVEIKSPDSENIGVGVINGDTSSGLYMSGSEQFLGQHSYDAGYYFNGILYVGNSSQSGSWTSYTSNDIIGIALDVDNGFVYFSKNGTFVNSGNPTSGATGTGGYNLSGIGSNGTYFIGCSTGNNSEHYVNFGNPIFSISSGNADGDGYGNFEYSVPSGYFCLNSKNLAEYG
jgi:hypothetical protein